VAVSAPTCDYPRANDYPHSLEEASWMTQRP